MTHLTHALAIDGSQKDAVFPPSKPVVDDMSRLPFQSGSRPPEFPADSSGTAEGRRAFFKTAEHRKLVTFGPEVRSRLN